MLEREGKGYEYINGHLVHLSLVPHSYYCLTLAFIVFTHTLLPTRSLPSFI